VVLDEKDIENLKQFEEDVKKESATLEEFKIISHLEQIIMISNPILFKFWVARDKINEKAIEMWKQSVVFRSG